MLVSYCEELERDIRADYYMIPVLHNYSHLAGHTVSWDTSDSEKNYLTNIQDSVKHQKLQDLGFLDIPILYQFNSHGFRNAEFECPVDIVCFGCSFTMGTGVPADKTWPSQLEQITGMSVANLGHAGSSNDTAFRFAKYYLPYLKPKWAIWVQTDQHRLELLDDSIPGTLNILANDTSNVCAQDHFIKTWFACDENQQLNLEKNTRAFEHLCQQLNINSHVLPRSLIVSDRQARDLMHPGPWVYKKLANQVQSLLGQPGSTTVQF
jgi:hypothetical protein